MSRQAQLGLFALAALFLLFGMFYIITNFGIRHSGYRIGVHFATASGLASGAEVLFSGVGVGSVDEIRLLPDNSVDVILAIQSSINIPRNSKFIIQAPITGTPNFYIIPPVPRPLPAGYVASSPPPEAILPKRVLPIQEQPIGGETPSVADMLQTGTAEVKRLGVMLTLLQQREPRLLTSMQTALDNVNQITGEMKYTVADVSSTLDATMRQAGANIVDMTGTLNSTLGRNQYKVDSLLGSLNSTAVALNQSMDSLRGLARDPRLKNNLISTTQNVARLTSNVEKLTTDLRTVTGNPETQGQLRDTIAHLDATMQKANSLLGSLGGESNVPGVDVGATPYPVPLPGASALPLPPGGKPLPKSTPASLPIRERLKRELLGLVALQVRFSYLNGQTVTGPNTSLTPYRGPLGDINAVLLPAGQYAVFAGANDIGQNTTYNAMLVRNLGHGFRLGGGVLYSQIGMDMSYDPGLLGLEARLYNLHIPVVDLYGNVNVTKKAKLFFGERDLNHAQRRTVFGLQLQF